MKVSYNWLKAYIDFDYTPEELNDILTMLGLEIGKVEKWGEAPALDKVVVGEVLTAEQHPNADRLRVCTVNVGEDEPLQIVCGAPNVAAGQKVPVAMVGAVLTPFGKSEADSFKIKKGKIRGEVSQGMICAEDELGLGTGHDGIMVLAEGLTPGTAFADTLASDIDYILEVELTPNRIDGASHYGVARDLAAYMRTKARLPEIKLDPAQLTEPNPIPATIKDRERCQRYTSLYISGVTVTDSPDWLKDRLQAIGLRPINNVVDITNFVLHELGQPMHAFDADQLKGGQIIVDTLPEQTKFVTLDDVERTLEPGTDLMINDAERPLCIGGVMGGLNSGVTTETKNVFLECAYFEPGTVRKTAKRLGISSDSSFRYERGADPFMPPTAALRAADLIQQIAGGTVSVMNDEKTVEDWPAYPVSLSLSKTMRLIGQDIGKDTVLSILAALEIEVAADNGDVLELRVPRYRVDVQRDVDVIEDILRVYGYNEVPLPEKLNFSLSFEQYQDVFRLKETYANYLSANGYYEIMNNSLVHKDLGDEKAVPIVNPLSEDLGIMRQSMLPGILEAIRHNQNRQQEDLAFYEFGQTYRLKGDGYDEKKWLAIVRTGKQHADHWQGKAPETALTTLAREVSRLQEKFGFEGTLREAQHPEMAYGLELLVDGKVVLTYGQVNHDWQQRYSLRNAVFYLLIDWEAVCGFYFNNQVKFAEIPQFPAIRRDISMLIPQHATFAAIETAIQKANPKLIR
ncbi:MAG: phenylalanine--tRNA ligase subunit beta, partial [Bacteroidota bacterium]